MSFVVYNVESTIYLSSYVPSKRRHVQYDDLKTLKAAKTALTRVCRRKGLNPADFAVAEKTYFHECIEKQETKKNLLSGKEFSQPVNTPASCDPSTETYHSM